MIVAQNGQLIWCQSLIPVDNLKFLFILPVLTVQTFRDEEKSEEDSDLWTLLSAVGLFSTLGRRNVLVGQIPRNPPPSHLG